MQSTLNTRREIATKQTAKNRARAFRLGAALALSAPLLGTVGCATNDLADLSQSGQITAAAFQHQKDKNGHYTVDKNSPVVATDVRVATADNGLRQFFVDFRNITSSRAVVWRKIEWLDKNGNLLPSSIYDWRKLELPSSGSSQEKFTGINERYYEIQVSISSQNPN
ncbi:MAG: hypothetical protein LBT53_08675 [Puniceicoccales bacterium]|jgi:hypothetical protein|nr:hypothetical protein [Puniceicoccales bacterium]